MFLAGSRGSRKPDGTTREADVIAAIHAARITARESFFARARSKWIERVRACVLMASAERTDLDDALEK